MAHSFSSDDKARMVLSVFRHHGTLPGEALRGTHFAEFAARKRWEQADLNAGLEQGVALGWFEAGAENGARLTKAGFDLIRAEQRVVPPR